MREPSPIDRLLHSRKFLLAVAALLITLLGHYASVPSDVLTMIDGVLVALIASIAWEDGAALSASNDTYVTNHYAAEDGSGWTGADLTDDEQPEPGTIV